MARTSRNSCSRKVGSANTISRGRSTHRKNSKADCLDPIRAGYQVHGLIRRSSSFNTGRIEHLYRDVHERTSPHAIQRGFIAEIVYTRTGPNMVLHYGDLTDTTNLVYIVSQVRPTEIYNLAAQSHVKVSFDMAEYTVRGLQRHTMSSAADV